LRRSLAAFDPQVIRAFGFGVIRGGRWTAALLEDSPMAILFNCVCGHHLKARDEMAGRRTMCPACGAPVGVPSTLPTHRGVTPGASSSSRRTAKSKRADEAVACHWAGLAVDRTRHSAAPPPIGHSGVEREPAGSLDATVGPSRVALRQAAVESVRIVTIRERQKNRRKPGWHLGTRWYHNVAYPICELLMLLALTLLLAISSAGILLLLPRFLHSNFASMLMSPILVPLLFLLFIPSLVAGHACMFLSRVAAHAASGANRFIGWPDLDPWPPLVSLVRWSVCILCGPALVGLGCLYYWLHAGVLRPLDWIIIAELLLPAATYALVAVMLASTSEEFVPGPLRVLGAIRQLGSKGLAAGAAGSMLLFGHLYMGGIVIGQLHRDVLLGLLLLVLFWFSALYCGTLLLRLVGMCWHHSAQKHRSWSAPPLWAIPGLTS
jgi:hypothetical protein